MKKLVWGLAGLMVLAAGGCASNEPEGFMPGDNLDLDGKPRPVEAAPAAAPGSVGAPAAYTPDKDPAPAPNEAVQKNTLGYAPDASGAPTAGN